jgi:ETFB lysine methyltransferase
MSRQVLCKVLEYRKDTLKGLRVCELGAGLGLCGIAAWMLGCSEAVLTDKEPMVVENLRLNSTIAFL